MKHHRTRTLTATGITKSAIPIALLVLALLVPASAQASAPRVTRGDAQAIFHAFPNGGWAVRLHAGTVEGAPTDFQADSIARISPAVAWIGRHFCSLDWHVINLAAIEGNAIGESRTNLEIRENLEQIRVDFTLDGAPLDTMSTGVSRTLNPEFRGFFEAFWVQFGRVMAPEDLSVGQHLLQATGFRPGMPPTVMRPVTFFIDAEGTGTCL
jgi:hypothetical protein